MKKSSLIAVGLAFIISCTGCGASEAADKNDSAPIQVVDTSDPNVLQSEELLRIQNIINEGKYTPFLKYNFTDPNDVLWDRVIELEKDFLWHDISGDEKTLKEYLRATGKDAQKCYPDVAKITTRELKEFVKETTGADYSEAKHPLTFLYLDKYDAYYRDILWFPCDEFTLLSGKKDGDIYTVEAELTSKTYDPHKRTFTFSMDGDNIKVISNIIHWEEEADRVFKFDSEIYGPTMICFYGDHGDFIADGNFQQRCSPHIHIGPYNTSFSTVDDAYFFDMNADDIKDIVFVGTIEGEERVFLLVSDPYEMEYDDRVLNRTNLDDIITEEVQGDFSEEAIRKAIFEYGDNGKYNSYKEAYAQFIYMYDNGEQNRVYAVKDLDEDGVPELIIVNTLSYYDNTFVYGFSDDHVISIGEDGYDQKKYVLGQYKVKYGDFKMKYCLDILKILSE